ncbi:uncharacterized protein LOC114644122 [Erpetoichthys calabaricus]|uniref:uncharacterized protein LOC114644122 n=1 Tax=Erpetoichthys calabaricus TaxID=27687 RepID=UPI00109FA3B1|nr:uncharacterized protein LOC114644122 [Erpetoichthys calabaricus]
MLRIIIGLFLTSRTICSNRAVNKKLLRSLKKKISLTSPKTIQKMSTFPFQALFTTSMKNYVTDTIQYMEVIEEYLLGFPLWWQKKITELTEIENITKKYASLKKKKIVLDRSSQERELKASLSEIFLKTETSYLGIRKVFDAIEKLALTSLAVFSDKNSFLEYPPGVNSEKVYLFVNKAKEVAPFLVNFLRDPKDLFKDGLENVEHLDYQQKLYCQSLYKLYYNLKSAV